MDITPSFVVYFLFKRFYHHETKTWIYDFFSLKLFINRLQNKFTQPNTWNWHDTEIQQLWVNLTVSTQKTIHVLSLSHTHTFRHASHSYHLQNLWDNSPEITVQTWTSRWYNWYNPTHLHALSLSLSHTNTFWHASHSYHLQNLWDNGPEITVALTNLDFTTMQGTQSYNSEVSISNLLHVGKKGRQKLKQSWLLVLAFWNKTEFIPRLRRTLILTGKNKT